MDRIVVDTDVASYIFAWHPEAKQYVALMGQAKLVLCFMSVAEMRTGAITARWGARKRTNLELFIGGFDVIYANNV